MVWSRPELTQSMKMARLRRRVMLAGRVTGRHEIVHAERVGTSWGTSTWREAVPPRSHSGRKGNH